MNVGESNLLLNFFTLIVVILIGTVIYALALRKVKAAEVWERTAKGWEARAEERQVLVEDLRLRVADQERLIQEYKSRPDLSTIQELITAIAGQISEAAASSVSAVVTQASQEHRAILEESVQTREVLTELVEAVRTINGKTP